MKTIKLFSKVILIILFMAANTLAQVYYIEQNTYNASIGSYHIGQTFTTGNSGGIISITVSAAVPTSNVIFDIIDDSVHSLLYEARVNITSGGLDELILSSPVYVRSNSHYRFLLSSPVDDNTDYELQLGACTGDTYKGGGEVKDDSQDGSTWYDLVFKVQIDENQPPSSISIKEGSTTVPDGGAYNFGGIEIGTNRDKQYTISNSGSGKLKLTTPIAFNSGSDPEFSVISQPDAEVEPGASTTFTVRFAPIATAAKTASLSIANNDATKNPYDITFNGSGGNPGINLKQSSTAIANGGSYNYGNADVRTNDDVIFTIENTGTALLILTTPLTLSGANADQFSITNQPSSEISAGSSATFTVRFSPTNIGSKTAAIGITNNTDDKNPYNFTLNGTGTDVEINLKQSSTDISDGGTYNFTNTDIGSSTDVIFTIQNTGNAARSLTITTPLSITGTNSNQYSITSQPASSISSGNSTTFTVRFAPTSEGSKSASIAITNNDSNENPYDLNLSGTAIGYPQMQVLGNDILINNNASSPNSSDGTDFGIVPLSSGTSVHTFTIKNTGNGTLHLNGSPAVSISGNGASDFSVTALPSATVGPNNATTTFQITFDPSANGVRNAEISIDNDDSNENPYNFSITGIGDNQIAPYVTNYSPENNGACYVRQNLILQFNEEVTAVAGKNINIYDALNNLFEQIPANDPRVTISGSQVTINPNGSFATGTEYNVQIDAGAFKDIVGDTYVGIQNSTTWSFTAGEADPPGRCFNFDGSNDYATISLTIPDNGTVEFWFNLNNTSTSQTFWDCNETEWYMSYISGDALYCKLSNAILKFSSVSAGKWYHAAVTWQRSGASVNYYLYVNGSLVDFTASSETWISPNSTVYIGSKNNSIYYLNGKLEEFRIWNDVRSSTEIQDNMFKILTGTESNLLVYYKLDEMNGSTFYDESGNSNNGSLFNASDDSWITSTAPAGTYGKSIRTNFAASIGASGKTITAQIKSIPSNTDYLGIYSAGNGDGKVTSDDFGASGATQRSNIIWGVEEYGSCTADITFNYSNITGFSSNELALKLLTRNDAASAWTDITGSAVQNTTNHTFTLSGISEFCQFAIGDGGTNPLPVELSSFTAVSTTAKAGQASSAAGAATVELKWVTATEVNDYGFEIQRSAVSGQQSVGNSHSSLVNSQWEKIGFVKGSGNCNSPKEYSFVDSNPLCGNVQYRLKQIDNDGGYKYSEIVEAKILPTKYELYQNYPNPFNPATAISYQLSAFSNQQCNIKDIRCAWQRGEDTCK